MKSEYLPWNKNKPAMIIKCAEAVVYKRFARLTDVYTQEEVDHILPGKIEKPTKPDISKMEAITSKKQ